MREKGRKWDGRSRVSTQQYKDNYDSIFKKKNIMTESQWQDQFLNKKKSKNKKKI